MSKGCVLTKDVMCYRLRAGTRGRVIHTYASGRAFICVSGLGGFFMADEWKESKGMQSSEKDSTKEKQAVIPEIDATEDETQHMEEQVRQGSAKAVRQWW